MNLTQLWYKAAKSGLRKPLNRVRHWGLDSRDAFIASYPRSGNTWLRFVLFDVLVSGQTSGFDEVNHIIPEVGLHLPGYTLLPGEGRLIKTHEPYQKEYRKAIYLVRDVRDVILSEFAYQKALGWIPDDFELFLQRFLDGQVNPFRPWQEHVPGWLESPIAGTPKMLVIKFEDMRRDTEAAVARALDFLGIAVEAEVIRTAIANNSVQKMQEKEAKQPQLSSSAPKPGSEETRFIRRGSTGGWRNRLTPAQAQRIEERSGELLAQLGYPVGEAARSALAAAAQPEAQQAVR